MKGGFLRGLFVGAVVGTVSGVLLDSDSREKAKNLIQSGGQLLQKAEDGMELASGWVHKGEALLHDEMPSMIHGMGGSGEMTEMFGNDREKMDSRVAVLEKRLEELESRGV